METRRDAMRCGIRLNQIHNQNQNQNPNTNVNLNPIPNQTECESNQETTCVANYTCRADTNTHTHIERYGAYNEWLCVWNPYNAVNWVLPPLPLLPCFSFHFNGLHVASCKTTISTTTRTNRWHVRAIYYNAQIEIRKYRRHRRCVPEGVAYFQALPQK